MSRSPKTAQLQIRLSAEEKRVIQRAAARAGQDMSAFVLSRVLSTAASEFQDLLGSCTGAGARPALAELNTWLTQLSAGELRIAVGSPPEAGLTPFLANTIAAMVELACARRAVAPPEWTRDIEPLLEPAFGSTLESLRFHLLKSSPAPFRRRNLFVDASVGDRV